MNPDNDRSRDLDAAASEMRRLQYEQRLSEQDPRTGGFLRTMASLATLTVPHHGTAMVRRKIVIPKSKATKSRRAKNKQAVASKRKQRKK